ncbi:NodT family efflux transporter outer membrane factor (OMF) lipoprotein [Panacagrimonas perspica]|uniref:NodT family efflux transporter outer membrane factor (OMF) lipoprotein n=1 Tax=Panacagrimonas perspica TaxID=381431 RepID=A0A4R7NRK2_9GAMM|nr:efflux transporter outer membrane subunit [Panacagrimonas perspica]TDU23322.1 NodT family efflux transporter outer membrane factor (OMF) lipoprotein [Panacagrimonas perspica]THD00691.1 RND transporter [Panacagrimonas perspica]
MKNNVVANAVAALGVTLLIAGCAVGPDYRRPEVAAAAQFKEAPEGWVAATPADAVDRGRWWRLFQDAQLDALAEKVLVDNQNIVAAQAAYQQARSLVREQRAGLFPVVSLDVGASRSRNSGGSNNGDGGGSQGTRNSFQASIGADWEPDVWGRLRRATTAADANAQASAADLANARLSAQGELVLNYLSLRETDEEIGLLERTLQGYERSLQIATNRYKVGVAPRSDLLSAQTQVYNATADLEGLMLQRDQLEHAIAVLTGRAPADFDLQPAGWNAVVPEVPAMVPSTLLLRRPDIASAERRLAAANEQIGIQTAGYFPNFGLSASYGKTTSKLSDLFSTSSMVWSIGVSAAQTLFDAGATGARVEQAQGAYDEAVANYRQVALTAFQNVEDQLSAQRVLARQHTLREQASTAADQNEQVVLNQYKAGQVSFTEVVVAQASALSARRALVQAALDRQTTAVALIQALGGGWDGNAEP